MEKNFRGLTLLLVVIAVALSLPLQAQERKAKDNAPPPVQRENSLHERARKAGGNYVLKYKTSRSTLYPNVEELAKRSDLIVVGRTVSHKANLSPDERFITQDFLVKVQEVIKGDFAPDRALLVSLPGGTHRFPDGTFVAMVPVGYKAPQDGGLYVFFLKSRKENDTAFRGHRVVSESQGIFALTGGTVQPAATIADDPVSSKYRAMPAGTFLQQIHQAVPRKKK